MAEKMRMGDKGIFGITKLKLQAFRLSVSTGNDSGGHCCKSRLNNGEVEHSERYMINIRVYLRKEFRSVRSDSHTICDSKHSICLLDDSKHSILKHLRQRSKKSTHACKENMTGSLQNVEL